MDLDELEVARAKVSSGVGVKSDDYLAVTYGREFYPENILGEWMILMEPFNTVCESSYFFSFYNVDQLHLLSHEKCSVLNIPTDMCSYFT